jgi:hypothetical protein
VLHDVARKVLAREPIALAMGYANIIWQGEANDWALRTLATARPDDAAEPERPQGGHPCGGAGLGRTGSASRPF